MMRYPPCDSTTLRQPSDSFSLFARRQAFICGGLPMCSAQNFPASERQVICSWGVGPDCACASEPAVSDRISAAAAAGMWIDFFTEFFMDHLSTGIGGLKARGNSSRLRQGSMPCSWRRKIACKRRAAPSRHLHGMLSCAPLHHVRLTSAAVTDRYIARLHAKSER